MGLAFFGFGAGTLKLFVLFSANAELLAAHGWQAVMDGGLQQLVELLLTGYLSLAADVVFKTCEHALVKDMATAAKDRPAG